MIIRCSSLLILAFVFSSASASFSFLRIYSGNNRPEKLSLPTSRKSPSAISRTDGRRLDVQPEIIPLKVGAIGTVRPTEIRNSKIKRIELSPLVTYVRPEVRRKEAVTVVTEGPSLTASTIPPVQKDAIAAVREKPSLTASIILPVRKDIPVITEIPVDITTEKPKKDATVLPAKAVHVFKNEESNFIDDSSMKYGDDTPTEIGVGVKVAGGSPRPTSPSRNEISTENVIKDQQKLAKSEIVLKSDAGKKVVDTRKIPNSPIFYIRLPPNPYNYVPGFGYVSAPSTDKNVLPVNFNANGKPSGLYFFNRPADDHLKPDSERFSVKPEESISPDSATEYSPATSKLTNQYELPVDSTEQSIDGAEDATEVAVTTPSTAFTTTTTEPPKRVITNSKITYIKGNFPFNGNPSAVFSVNSPYKPNYFEILHDFFYPGRKKPVAKL